MSSDNNIIGKYDDLCEELEKQEIDAPNGVPPAHIYQQLLAVYVYQNDLPNAKFLWKRIPPSSKSSTAELAAIWEVGKNLWLRDFQGVYSTLAREWSPIVKHIMADLQEKMHKRAIDLVAKAYTSIGIEDFAQLLNLTTDEALSKAKELGWLFDTPTHMVLPVKSPPKPHAPLPSEEQLRRLAEYVSFLEN